MYMTEVRQIPPESLHLSLGETKVWKACVSCGPAVVGKESPGVSETTPPPTKQPSPSSSVHQKTHRAGTFHLPAACFSLSSQQECKYLGKGSLQKT